MLRAKDEAAVAILAKAPVAGLAKTRLIPALGAHAAAYAAERMLEHAVATARAAGIGPVTLWGTPDIRHRAFRDLVASARITLRAQPAGDLGARMLAAVAASGRPTLVIGTDCPALTPQHLRGAARALQAGTDVVVIPAQDGGYVLIGLRQPQPILFADMPWGTAAVMPHTRRRIADAALSSLVLDPLWDVDAPADYERLVEARLIEGLV
ncbi:MAG: TIGR04282 family arsenosugar biosynthesis glycosyltransferase [Pseudorhodoplanes sp.]